jgi:hypothetical protein
MTEPTGAQNEISEATVKRAAKVLWRRHHSILWKKASIADRSEYIADARAVIAAARKGVALAPLAECEKTLLDLEAATDTFILQSGIVIIRRSQYEALLAFFTAWNDCEVATATGDSNPLAVATKALAEQRQVVEAELRVPTFRVVSDAEIEQLASRRRRMTISNICSTFSVKAKSTRPNFVLSCDQSDMSTRRSTRSSPKKPSSCTPPPPD